MATRRAAAGGAAGRAKASDAEKIGRTLDKLSAAVAAGDFYGALQMYRTVVKRYVDSVPDGSMKGVTTLAAGGLRDALTLVVSGANTLAAHGKAAECWDLGDMLVKTILEAKAVPLAGFAVAAVEAIAAGVSPSSSPAPTMDAYRGRLEFLKGALRWANKAAATATASASGASKRCGGGGGVVSASEEQLLARLHLLAARTAVAIVDAWIAEHMPVGSAAAAAAKLPPSRGLIDVVASMIGEALKQYGRAGDTVCPLAGGDAAFCAAPLPHHDPYLALLAPESGMPWQRALASAVGGSDDAVAASDAAAAAGAGDTSAGAGVAVPPSYVDPLRSSRAVRVACKGATSAAAASAGAGGSCWATKLSSSAVRDASGKVTSVVYTAPSPSSASAAAGDASAIDSDADTVSSDLDAEEAEHRLRSAVRVHQAAAPGQPMHEFAGWLLRLSLPGYDRLASAAGGGPALAPVAVTGEKLDLTLARPVLSLAAHGHLRDANALYDAILNICSGGSAAAVAAKQRASRKAAAAATAAATAAAKPSSGGGDDDLLESMMDDLLGDASASDGHDATAAKPAATTAAAARGAAAADKEEDEHSETALPLPQAAVLNTHVMRFLALLLPTLERDAAPLYKRLLKTYEPALAGDAGALKPLLDAIGAAYFGIQQPLNPMQAMMKNMAAMFNPTAAASAGASGGGGGAGGNPLAALMGGAPLPTIGAGGSTAAAPLLRAASSTGSVGRGGPAATAGGISRQASTSGGSAPKSASVLAAMSS